MGALAVPPVGREEQSHPSERSKERQHCPRRSPEITSICTSISLLRGHAVFLILGLVLPALRTLALITSKSHKHPKKEVNIRSVIPFRALQIL